MKEQLKKYQEKHIDEMLRVMDEHQYRFRRYNSIFTVALFYCDGLTKHRQIAEMIRKTDYYFRLEEDLFLLIFGETGGEGGIIAAEKVLSKLPYKPGQNIYVAVAVVEGNKDKEGTLLVHQLFNILEFAIEHNHINEVVDTNYFDGVY